MPFSLNKHSTWMESMGPPGVGPCRTSSQSPCIWAMLSTWVQS